MVAEDAAVVTKAPRWLDYHWRKAAVAESLLTGSLEKRAERIAEIVKAEQDAFDRNKTIKPNQLKALALDLAAAAADQRKWLKPVERLLVLALKLPEGHEAGGWFGWSLDLRGHKRGKLELDLDAWSTAAMIDSGCYRRWRKVKSQHALARDLRSQGFKTPQRTISDWRQKAYGERPGHTSYVPPNPPQMTRDEESAVPPFRTWRIKVLKSDDGYVEGIKLLMPDEWPPE
jgi:hypothetical protein